MDKQNTYIEILKEELVPALGCTEPIAIAYTGAALRSIMDGVPEQILIESSGNIVKNAKSVIVPNTGGMKGIEASAVIGIIGGNLEKKLEVLSDVNECHVKEAKEYLSRQCITIKLMESPASLHIRITGKLKGQTAVAELIHQHTNIVLLKKNDTVVYQKPYDLNAASSALTDRSTLNVKDIIDFANTVDLSLVKPFIEKQIEYNMKVANEGLTNCYGIQTGKNILKYYKENSNEVPVEVKVKSHVAAASDARMCGSPYPVITNSGSGNQGLAVSVPVIVYGEHEKISHENLIRALIVSNLLAIHQKTGIGRLSAYCGAVTAAAACAAAITYMKKGTYEQICGTISNTLGTVSGMLCDGAKQSCASKIAIALDSAILAHKLAMEGQYFQGGDGVIKTNIESTIKGIGKIASKGMQQTDKVVLDVMLETK